MKKKTGYSLIATLPPHVGHRDEIIGHPAVDELRLNTVSPLSESRRDTLRRLKRECGRKRLWIDLKGRQLRIAKFAYLPYAFVEISHPIEVELPVEVLFRDGAARIVEIVGGTKLILDSRPPRVVGEGEPINILDPSLRVDGYLTEADREYVEAAASLGLHDYLLSFVEDDGDIEAVREIDPEARVVAKIESRRGLEWMRERPSGVGLMAARDDLYVAMGDDKAGMLAVLRSIARSDSKATVASRLLESLETAASPSLPDLSDVELMREMGYRNYMLSDTLCFRREPFLAAAGLMARLLGKEES